MTETRRTLSKPPKVGTIEFLRMQEGNVRIMTAAIAQMTGSIDDRVSAILQCGAMMQMHINYDPTELRVWFNKVCDDLPDQAGVADYWKAWGGK